MNDWEERAAFILDSGSGMVKCGFAGEEVPRGVFQAAVAHPSNNKNGPFSVGDAALQGKNMSIKYPISHGIINDWDALEKLWRHAYDSVNCDPTQQAVMITEAPMNPKSNREKILELIFDSFQVPAMHIQIQAVLSLYSVGRTEGCILDSGDGVTHAVPVYEGHTVPTAIQRIDIAGRDLTEWLMQLLTDETDRPFTTSGDQEIARDIKEKLCYVAEDFDSLLDKATSAGANDITYPYLLPDGTELQLCRSLFSCPEALFDPNIIERGAPGIQNMIYTSINECSIDIRRTLYKNIVLCGGSTMFKGLETRLSNEIRLLANPNVRDDIKVIAPNERKFSVWMGAALLASLTSFNAEWITKEEYNESGPSIVHKRCAAFNYVEK